MLNVVSLREQVYQYLRDKIYSGELSPGSFIVLDGLSKELNISKTPLKEALIKLECEGFVEILPRRGFLVKTLTYQEIKDYYEILGSLESSVVLSVFDQFTEDHLAQMKGSNEDQLKALEDKEFDKYYQLNLDFHDIFLNLSSNLTLRRYLIPIKQRLYDFPRRQYWKEWELLNIEEHRKFISSIENGDREGAARLIKEEHWGWKVHEPYFLRFYGLNGGPGIPEDLT